MSNPTAIDIWRKELEYFTLTEAVILLRNLGGFQYDKLTVLLKDPRLRGYRQFAFCDLLDYLSGTCFCRHIHPVYFTGGPQGGKQFKGTLLTMVIDRVIRASIDKGPTFAFKTVDYARSFRTRKIPVGHCPSCPSDSSANANARRVLGLA
jgi:hypothetical protein